MLYQLNRGHLTPFINPLLETRIETLLAFMREKLRESGDPHLVELERELNDSQLLTVIKAFSSDDSTEAVDSA